METVRRLRAMASLCRQSAAYHPERSWNLLAEAEYWEHLANGELLGLFEECTGSSNELAARSLHPDIRHADLCDQESSRV
ncbi:hypothetical protein [Bradyrhizobium sp. 23]|uniref:hypothetical protein n=1 Tax=Bradyrhizobium sp. 23 TaxID=2782667 RepID=UPI001FFA5A17|nr:hypothetical protein [Bradyrhizobium sp. 23]MCK1317366.1 hypothetical protein [Bradyrhizobium sp. 23]